MLDSSVLPVCRETQLNSLTGLSQLYSKESKFTFYAGDSVELTNESIGSWLFLLNFSNIFVSVGDFRSGLKGAFSYLLST